MKPEEKNPKKYNVIVNGRPKEVNKDEMSFAEIVALAYDASQGGVNIVFTVTYRRGHGSKAEGTLVDGDTVKIKEGMIFNVTRTDKS